MTWFGSGDVCGAFRGDVCGAFRGEMTLGGGSSSAFLGDAGSVPIALSIGGGASFGPVAAGLLKGAAAGVGVATTEGVVESVGGALADSFGSTVKVPVVTYLSLHALQTRVFVVYPNSGMLIRE